MRGEKRGKGRGKGGVGGGGGAGGEGGGRGGGGAPASGGSGPAPRIREDLQQKYGSQQLCTTLMIQNIPRTYVEEALALEIEQVAGPNKFDFFYMPWDTQRDVNLTYAFVNFMDPLSATHVAHAFTGKKWTFAKSTKVSAVAPAYIQGVKNNLEYYRNRAVCAENSEHAPAVFENGVRLNFQKALEIYLGVSPQSGSQKGRKNRPRSEDSPSASRIQAWAAQLGTDGQGGPQKPGNTRPRSEDVHASTVVASHAERFKARFVLKPGLAPADPEQAQGASSKQPEQGVEYSRPASDPGRSGKQPVATVVPQQVWQNAKSGVAMSRCTSIQTQGSPFDSGVAASHGQPSPFINALGQPQQWQPGQITLTSHMQFPDQLDTSDTSSADQGSSFYSAESSEHSQSLGSDDCSLSQVDVEVMRKFRERFSGCT